MRDADLSDKQLRDDLMTMLIAGHDTTAAVLTWTLFALLTHPTVYTKMLAEIDSVLGDKTPSALSALHICDAITLPQTQCVSDEQKPLLPACSLQIQPSGICQISTFL